MGTDTDKEKAIKKRSRGRPKGSKSGYTMSEKAIAVREHSMEKVNGKTMYEGEDRDYNARQIDHVLKIHEIASHANRKDPASLRSCFINYVLLCQQDGFKVGNLAAAVAMGIKYSDIQAWSVGKNEEYKQLAIFVKNTCAMMRENLIADQKINPVIGIFWQRNYDGLRNDTEQQQAIQETSKDEGMTAEDYSKKYGNLIDE